MNKFCFNLLFLCSVPSLLFAEDTLIFAVDIIRHGDRTPIVPLSSVNYQWQEGPGQLTAEGMQQEYKLGLLFRKKYVEQAHLLPEHYEPGTMYVRSTDFDRTLMSAQSLLMGLYPPGTGPNIFDSIPALPHAFQPIPIFSAPSKSDEVIVQHVPSTERLKLLAQYVYATKEWQEKNHELRDKYPLWSAFTGIPIKNLADLELLGDALYIHQIAYSTKLMTNIAHYLNDGSQKKSKLKYVLLSAHDVTIASAMSFLGAPLEIAPPYASNLNFSLYEHSANYFLVKVTYNGNPVPIPACGGTTCDLEQFTHLINTSTPEIA